MLDRSKSLEPQSDLTETAMSRTIKFAKAGGPEVLEFVEIQVPAPGPNEVRIKVKAIGINRAEAMWRVDDYIEPVKFPAGLGYEAAGIVDAVGKDVSGFAAGDEVNVIPSFSMNDYTTYGEVILVPDYAVVRQPKALSFTEAASVWMMFVTAYGALIEDAKVDQGGFRPHSGGVQQRWPGGDPDRQLRGRNDDRADANLGEEAATPRGRRSACHRHGRSRPGRGGDADHQWPGRARRLRSRRRPGVPKLVSALAFGGIIYIYGLLSTGITPLPVLEMIAKVTTIKAHNIWLTSGDETRRKAAIEFVTKGLQTGALKPVIDRTFTFDEMADVHRYLEQSGQFGKIVVTV